MEYKIIKTENEYKTALERVSELMDIGSPNDEVLEEINILSLLIEQYEKENYPIDPVDPIEYIKFKMDQDGLSNKDMVKYIGSSSKVSEVLSYKVKLNLNMIHSLNEGLGIPLEILSRPYEMKEIKGRYPVEYYKIFNELVKRNYFRDFKGTLAEAKKRADELIDSLIGNYLIGKQCYCRRTENADIDTCALFFWQCRIKQMLEQEELPAFDLKKLPDSFMQDVAHLSYYTDGCKLVKDHLNKFGIHFAVLRHLPKTNLDGAVFMLGEHPVVALTLRYDRHDNFWFTLMHEIVHVLHHLKEESVSYFDDTNSSKTNDEIADYEAEANRIAEETFIPSSVWKNINKNMGYNELESLSNSLKIHPAIIAGRIRYTTGNYKHFSNIVNQGGIREKF